LGDGGAGGLTVGDGTAPRAKYIIATRHATTSNMLIVFNFRVFKSFVVVGGKACFLTISFSFYTQLNKNKSLNQ
jgi:hypothetical protein